MNRTKKKAHQKIKIALNFMKEILLKFTRNKKKIISEIMPQKYPTTTMTLGAIIEKTRLRSVILKIVGVSP